MDLLSFYIQQLKFSIIPISMNTKVPPAGFDLIRRQTQRATLSEIREWQRKYPKCRWGLMTGKISGVIVVDVDPKNGGEMPKEIAHLSPTTITPSGGTHSYFKYVEGALTKHPKGIDIQSDGVYVILPPSNGYKWYSSALQLREHINREFPALILPGRVINTSPLYAQTKVLSGNRHAFLCSRAGRLQRYGYSHEIIFKALQDDNLKYCDPPKSDEELKKLVDSMKYVSEGLAEDLAVKADGDMINPHKDLENWLNVPPPEFYLKTGFKDYDQVQKLWAPGSVHTIAGKSGVGKSLLNLYLTMQFLNQGKSVLLFTTEMSRTEVYQRAFIMSGLKNKQDFFKQMREKSFYVCDNFIPTLDTVMKISKLHAPDILSFDYVQHLCGRSGQGLTDIITSFVRGMKQFSQEHKTVVILVSQLAKLQRIMSFRTGEQIVAHPTTQDLKNSSTIEHESDAISMIEEIDENKLQISLLKNRHGERPVFVILKNGGQLMNLDGVV